MVNIRIEVLIKKRPDQVFSVISNLHKYASSVKDVKGIERCQKAPNSFVSKWEIDFDGVPFTWTQEEVVYERTRVVLFKSVEGDFFIYCGEWNVMEQKDGSSLLRLDAYFNWGIPNIEKYVGGTLERKAKKALKGLVLSLKKVVMSLDG